VHAKNFVVVATPAAAHKCCCCCYCFCHHAAAAAARQLVNQCCWVALAFERGGRRTAFRALAEALQGAAATTADGKSLFPEDHRQYMGEWLVSDEQLLGIVCAQSSVPATASCSGVPVWKGPSSQHNNNRQSVLNYPSIYRLILQSLQTKVADFHPVLCSAGYWP